MADKLLSDAFILLSSACDEIDTGFVACSRCGDQEDTKDLDFADDLKQVKDMLLAYLISKGDF